MQINLDIHELWYLLERCLHGSHLRSSTIERFVNEFYDKLEEHERMSLFEWAVRLGYCWSDHTCFEPSDSCCGADVVFMKRYHPENQYSITMKNGDKVRAFLMHEHYHVGVTRYCSPEYITKVEKINLSDPWEEHKQKGVDYDTNILE